jgi:hypothetical protein
MVLPWGSLQVVKTVVKHLQQAYQMLEMLSSGMQSFQLQNEQLMQQSGEAMHTLQKIQKNILEMHEPLQETAEKSSHLMHLNVRANAAELRMSLSTCRVGDLTRHLQQAFMLAADDVSVDAFTAECLHLEMDYQKACGAVEDMKFIEIVGVAVLGLKSRLMNQKALKIQFEAEQKMEMFQYQYGKDFGSSALEMMKDCSIDIFKRVWQLEILKDLKTNSMELLKKDESFFEFKDGDSLSLKLLKNELLNFRNYMKQHQLKRVSLEDLQIDGPMQKKVYLHMFWEKTLKAGGGGDMQSPSNGAAQSSQ